MQKEIAGHPAEDPFLEAAMGIGASDDEVGAMICRHQRKAPRIISRGRDRQRPGMYPMAPEPFADLVKAAPCFGQVGARCDLENRHAKCLVQQRQAIGDRPSGLRAIFPAN